MVQQIADRRDIDFVLHEQFGIEKFSESEIFADFNKKTIDLIISEARNLAIKELLPTREDGDKTGCEFDSGKVKVPESFHHAYKLFAEGEWIAMTEDPEWGGQGMPRTVALAASEYFNGANFPLLMYPGLTHGAGLLIETFGTEKQKKLFLKKMFNGEWTGTMLLTEPEAGSDVGLLNTTAVKNDDGTYSITGNKIFISGGEHDITENIIHPVLARIEGAPAGTKGISLFLVPKIWVNDDGSLGEPNDVVCTGIEHKMGIHGNATCSITLGGKGQCRGMLLGEANKGMRAMFLMMNEARLLVGMQGQACASASYLEALKYAKERIQGKDLREALKKDAPEGAAIPIIQHPDVRRQLLTMKAYVEGMRSLLYYVGYLTDRKTTSSDDGEKQKTQKMIDLLIPVAKGYVTDRAIDICSQGMQIFGGYGYIKEYPMEQLYRDCRITAIYEGTNGIQSMDLLGRKLGMDMGQVMMAFIGKINKTAAEAKGIESLTELAGQVESIAGEFGKVAMHIGKVAMSPKILTAFANSYNFMEIMGDVTVAWMLLWRAMVATRALAENPKKKDVAFYEGQIKTAEFFITTIIPVTAGKVNSVMASNEAVIEISEESFGN